MHVSSYWPLISVISGARTRTCVFVLHKRTSVGRDSSVGVATRYGLSGPGIESRWGRDFPQPSRPTLGPTQPPIQGYRVFPGGKTAGTLRWPPTPSGSQVKERVELYLYSLSGPSWPVLGWTVPFTFTFINGISPRLKFTAYTHSWKGLLVIQGRTGSCKTFRKISLVMTKCVVQGFIAYSILRSDNGGRIK